jgi:cation-transporting ATPase 13A1
LLTRQVFDFPHVVARQGLKSETRNKFKLVLHCIMIVTSVVPPELPMELSMAVTNSLAALAKLFVYCTEPFRIPFAGKVTICCFDKTGTLTQDKMLFRGMVNETGEVAMGITGVASHVVATCHSLVMINKTFRGDPIEKAAIETISCRPDGQNTVTLQDGGRSTTFTIRHRYAFSAALKRMSVLVQDSQQKSLRAFTKGNDR